MEFDKLLNERIEKIIQVLGSKAKEYAHQGDRLHNFKVAARIDGVSAVKAAWGMAKKHLVSVIDIVNGDLPNNVEIVDEKIGDMVNYLILMEALLKEERDWFDVAEPKQPYSEPTKKEVANEAMLQGKQFRL